MRLSYAAFEVLQSAVTHGSTDRQLTGLTDTDRANAVEQLIDMGLLRRVRQNLVATPAAKSALEPFKVKRAVILAAGRGERLRPETDTVPKPMVRVHHKRIIETQLDALSASGIRDITIVRGYRGEMFDELLDTYPNITFIDNPKWQTTNGIVSAALAMDLLSGAYLIESDLFIRNKAVIRPYEYASSYCGTLGATHNDWYFSVDKTQKIRRLIFGNSQSDDYKFVGIMYWAPPEAKQLKTDLKVVLKTSTGQQGFIEGVPFKVHPGLYNIFARRINKNDVVEIDTYQELLSLRAHEQLAI